MDSAAVFSKNKKLRAERNGPWIEKESIARQEEPMEVGFMRGGVTKPPEPATPPKPDWRTEMMKRSAITHTPGCTRLSTHVPFRVGRNLY